MAGHAAGQVRTTFGWRGTPRGDENPDSRNVDLRRQETVEKLTYANPGGKKGSHPIRWHSVHRDGTWRRADACPPSAECA
jgi:hypothetical protein